MKTILLMIQFFFAVAFTSAQVVPWNYTNTGIVHTINISGATITVDNRPIQNGDVIGVFYDSSGSLACGGYSVWPSSNINAYGDNSGEPNGFSISGTEPFKFKIWSKQRNCVVDSGTIIQFQYMPPTYNDSIYFKGAGGSSKMITLNGVNKNVYYAKTNYCIGDADPLPIKIGTLPDLSFSSQSGLSINASTGKINIAASTAGTYTVYFNSSHCLSSNSFRITIKMNLGNLNVGITKSGCTENGQVEIDPNSIICGTAPYQYKLRNIITGQEITSSSSLFADVADATYELFIKDINNEEVKWDKNVVVSKNCKDLLIAPNSPNGLSATYYIPYEGKAKIYDRFGLLRKEMSIPADWDATDNTGNQVSMGQYVIICNEDKQIVVTVIK